MSVAGLITLEPYGNERVRDSLPTPNSFGGLGVFPWEAEMASFVRMGEDYSSTATAPAPVCQQEWAQKLPHPIGRGVEHLLSLQDQEGYWLGELEADTTLESDYIYYLFVLGKADPVRILKLANYVRQRQLPDGGWNIYPGGPSELNATCKAYFALKLA